ncbi:MAG: ASKHA domain-containing protein [Candidatus Bathyarchaeota archaeon]|nr:ASKHA domain-containing protein [Candidatus Bathyarchaeota archaeon]
MPKVIIRPEGVEAEARTGELLLDAAERAGVGIVSVCGRQGVCGRCRVKVLSGSVVFSPEDAPVLDPEDVDEGWVLGCRATVGSSDVEILVPAEARGGGDKILTTDTLGGEGVALSPLVQKIRLDLPPPTIADSLSDLDRLFRDLRKQLPEGTTDPTADFPALQHLARTLRESDWRVTAAVHTEGCHGPHLRIVEPGDRTARNFGVAVDVGTTTIVCQLMELATGRVLGTEAAHNRQARFGDDVISRMIHACTRGGLEELRDAAVGTVNTLVEALVSAAGIHRNDITCYVVAGNTTMTHLLLGLEPCSIRIEPYIPTANRFPPITASAVGLIGHPRAVLHCVPCVSSYVGGDITAGVLACRMHEETPVTALIDVGTNGEIVIGNSEWLVCCSASAGPAFEGGGMKCGMRAARGAIQKVALDGPAVRYEVIGGGAARGICGSGLIDVIAELLLARIIDQSGRFIDLSHPRVRRSDDVTEFVVVPERATETGEAVVVTEDDIQNLMKSKGAVLAAVKVLLENLGMGFGDLQRLYVAGGFGASLDIPKAILIGLLPDIPVERVRFIGNSSLAGARLSLLSREAFRKTAEIARRMTYLELSVHPGFMNEFVAALFLPHTQMEMFPTVRERLSPKRHKRD